MRDSKNNFFIFLFSAFLFFNCFGQSKIDQECLSHLEMSCSPQEIDYINRIIKKDLEFLGNYKFLELHESPKLEIFEDGTAILTAKLAIFNGFVWKYIFTRMNRHLITGTRQRIGHDQIEPVKSENLSGIFKWLCSFINFDQEKPNCLQKLRKYVFG